MIEEADAREGPGHFNHTSHSYVWPGEELNLGVHLLPGEFSHEEVRLGLITRATYQALESVSGGLNDAACFVMLHYEPASHNVHVTMLPVGEEESRVRLDAQLKSGTDGFNNLLSGVIGKLKSGVSPNGVSILYNTPADLDTPSKVATVHELGVNVERADGRLEMGLQDFLEAIHPRVDEAASIQTCTTHAGF